MKQKLPPEVAERLIAPYIGAEIFHNFLKLKLYKDLSYEQAKVISLLEFGEVDETIDDATLIDTIVAYLSNNEDVKDLTYKSWQYLTSQQFVVPMFIEPGHPMNGANLIELGYAINYRTEQDVIQ
jgi:hypothetical protein